MFGTIGLGAVLEVGREALGFGDTDIPKVGERIIATFNQHAYGLMNGEQGIIESFEDVRPHEAETNEPADMMFVRIKSLTDGRVRRAKFNPACFSDDAEKAKLAMKSVGGVSYGYAITVHRSQGSEWERVLVIDEPMGDVRKLRYTAYTRAKSKLTVYRRS